MPIDSTTQINSSLPSQASSRHLYQALYSGDIAQVRQALLSGADPSSKLTSGSAYPLSVAAQRNWLEALEMLKQAGAQFPSDDELWRCASRGGYRALRWVASHPEALASLSVSDPSRQDALSIVCGLALTRSARMLLSLGAPCSRPDDKGRQPLHYASYGGRMAIMSLLLNAGASPSARDDQGATPAHNAAYTNAIEALRLLRRAGADLNAKNDFNEGAVFWAVHGKSEQAALFLAARGADLTTPSSRQEVSPIQLATQLGLNDLTSKLEGELARRERRDLAQTASIAPASLSRKPRV